MKSFLLLPLLCEPLTGYCQASQSLPQGKEAAADTARLGEVARLARQLQLPALPAVASQPRHVRFFTAGMGIDFWQTSAGTNHGQVVHWVREIAPGKEPATNREFVLTQPLAPTTVQALFAMFDSTHLLVVPDERAIRGWNRNILDGVAYTVEYQDAHTHQVATYSNPASQEQLVEAQLVTHFIERLYSLSQLRTLTQLFVGAIPYESYTDGSGTMVLRVVSYAQHLAYKRDRQRYRRQQAQRTSPME